jgi:hypothetical protein
MQYVYILYTCTVQYSTVSNTQRDEKEEEDEGGDGMDGDRETGREENKGINFINGITPSLH